MKVFNTMTRQMEVFEPLEAGHVRLYTCGPTVYDFAHIGNFRAYVFEDILRRTLRYAGFRVTQVMNLTDVDDKTIRRSREAGVPLADYTRTFKDAFFQDIATLNIEKAEFYPAATDHIPAMIALIAKLFDRGCAYQSEDGSVYFSIARFPGYGKLAHLDRSGLQSGVRVAQDEYEKENAADFALWKAWDRDDGDVAWDSPWGRGRPGWHIECSAMSSQYLGETFDVHTGGVDNIFPHHEDEIAQSEAANGRPFVRYWMHCAHLMVDGRKMAKSLGNFYTLRDLTARGYTGRELRYVLASAHYRQSLNFTFAALDGARASLSRLDDFVARVANEGETGGDIPGWAARARDRFRAGMDNDLNVPEAMAALFDMVHEGNRAMDAGAPGGSLRAVSEVLADMDRVLGFLTPETSRVDEALTALLAARAKARAAKDWAMADQIRAQLAERGWDVRDTPEGPQLKKR